MMRSFTGTVMIRMRSPADGRHPGFPIAFRTWIRIQSILPRTNDPEAVMVSSFGGDSLGTCARRLSCHGAAIQAL